MDCHPGHPANMMSREEFVERFRIQASPVLQGERLEKAIDTCLLYTSKLPRLQDNSAARNCSGGNTMESDSVGFAA